MKEFIDKTPTQSGTPINRKNLMAIQGFNTKTIIFNGDGSITETNGDNETLTTRFNSDGTFTQTFVGKTTATKTIRIIGNRIEEVVG